MTRNAQDPPHVLEKDRHVSRHGPGSSAGPNKVRGPTGAGELGIEAAAERDAQRDRDEALREGDDLPSQAFEQAQRSTNVAAPSGQREGFGAASAVDKSQGFARQPNDEERENLQGQRNDEWHKDQPNLLDIARTSGGSGADNALTTGGKQVPASERPVSDLVDTVGRSVGTESGTGAFDGRIGSAPTNARPEPYGQE